MTALLLSFVVGLGLSMSPRGVLHRSFIEFRASPHIRDDHHSLCCLHIFGIFLNTEARPPPSSIPCCVSWSWSWSSRSSSTQFCFAGVVARRNPIKALR